MDMDEHVRREEGSLNFDPLAILPDALKLKCGIEGFDLPDIEHTPDRLLALGHGIKSEPFR